MRPTFLLLLLVAVPLWGCTPSDPAPQSAATPREAQQAFFQRLGALCGQTFGGRTILAPPTDTIFEPARLYMVGEACGENEIRVRFIVGEDDSRTWVFHLGNDGLAFFHEHLQEDGTEYENSGFGGNASDEGTATFQSFPDFRATAETPPSEHRIWRLRFDEAHDLFVYYLDRGGEPAYRLVFFMGEASPPLLR
jgi:hypothetical protein